MHCRSQLPQNVQKRAVEWSQAADDVAFITPVEVMVMVVVAFVMTP